MHASFFTIRLVALAAIASVVTGQTLPAGCDRCVTVQSGDTSYIYQLAAVNSDILNPACDNLFVGEVLCLGITGQDCNVTHVMQTGDTCYSVATAAGIPINTLLTNNPNVNTICTNVYPGEVLCTASQIYVNITYSN
ncbi:hypothetical protein EDB19DRAFT_1929872 [Suillus lakei]|nr:hypothetical protein EDB19DRAFT_1929872 [Suillus lakei]